MPGAPLGSAARWPMGEEVHAAVSRAIARPGRPCERLMTAPRCPCQLLARAPVRRALLGADARPVRELFGAALENQIAGGERTDHLEAIAHRRAPTDQHLFERSVGADAIDVGALGGLDDG